RQPRQPTRPRRPGPPRHGRRLEDHPDAPAGPGRVPLGRLPPGAARRPRLPPRRPAQAAGERCAAGRPGPGRAGAERAPAGRRRPDAGHKLALPCLDLGPAQVLLLPGEAYVEYQLLAQKLRPGSFVVTLGYGECATGYVPTERAVKERDGNLSDWCWVAPGAEKVLTKALGEVLK